MIFRIDLISQYRYQGRPVNIPKPLIVIPIYTTLNEYFDRLLFLFEQFWIPSIKMVIKEKNANIKNK